MVKRALLLLPIITVALLLAACGSDKDDQPAKPTVSDAWVRVAPEGVNVSAAYMTISGNDTLIGVSVPSDVAQMAELHKTMSMPIDNNMGASDSMDSAASADKMGSADETHSMGSGDKMMGMEAAGRVAVNGTLQLKPGGYHIMLTGLKKPLAEGEQVTITLNFEKAGNVVVEAPVRANG